MQFLYIFSLMFLSIFGLTMVIRLAACAFLSRDLKRHDVYVRSGEDIGSIVEELRKSPRIGRVVIIPAGGEHDEEARRLAERFGNVSIKETER